MHNDPHWNVCPVCKKPRGRGTTHIKCSAELKARGDYSKARRGADAKEHYLKPGVIAFFAKL